MPERKGVNMRLSKKGFNNVLIFGILLITFFFNFSQRLQAPLHTEQKTVLSPAFTILEIKTPDYVLTRIGREWQRKPSMGLSKETLKQVVSHWQTIPLTLLTAPEVTPSDYIFYFYVAEQTQPILVKLYQLANNQYALQINETEYLSLPSDKLPLFLGR